MRRAKADGIETGNNLVFHDLAYSGALPFGIEHPESASCVADRGHCVASPPEQTLDACDRSTTPVSHPLPFRSSPLGCAPRQVVPAQAGVVNLVGHDRGVECLQGTVAGPVSTGGQERVGERFADRRKLDHEDVERLLVTSGCQLPLQLGARNLYLNLVAGQLTRHLRRKISVANLVSGDASSCRDDVKGGAIQCESRRHESKLMDGHVFAARKRFRRVQRQGNRGFGISLALELFEGDRLTAVLPTLKDELLVLERQGSRGQQSAGRNSTCWLNRHRRGHRPAVQRRVVQRPAPQRPRRRAPPRR